MVHAHNRLANPPSPGAGGREGPRFSVRAPDLDLPGWMAKRYAQEFEEAFRRMTEAAAERAAECSDASRPANDLANASTEADEFARTWSAAFAVAKRKAIEDLLSNDITPHGTSRASQDNPER